MSFIMSKDNYPKYATNSTYDQTAAPAGLLHCLLYELCYRLQSCFSSLKAEIKIQRVQLIHQPPQHHGPVCLPADELFPVPPSWLNSEQTLVWCVHQWRDHLPQNFGLLFWNQMPAVDTQVSFLSLRKRQLLLLNASLDGFCLVLLPLEDEREWIV